MNYYRMNEKTMELIGRVCENLAFPTDYEIKGEFIPVESLISIIEDLYGEVEHVREEFEDFKRDVEDNYVVRPISDYTGDCEDDKYFKWNMERY